MPCVAVHGFSQIQLKILFSHKCKRREVHHLLLHLPGPAAAEEEVRTVGATGPPAGIGDIK